MLASGTSAVTTALVPMFSVLTITPRRDANIAVHSTLEFSRYFDFDLHDRLKQHGLGLHEVLAKTIAGTDLERHIARVNVVV